MPEPSFQSSYFLQEKKKTLGYLEMSYNSGISLGPTWRLACRVGMCTSTQVFHGYWSKREGLCSDIKFNMRRVKPATAVTSLSYAFHAQDLKRASVYENTNDKGMAVKKLQLNLCMQILRCWGGGFSLSINYFWVVLAS